MDSALVNGRELALLDAILRGMTAARLDPQQERRSGSVYGRNAMEMPRDLQGSGKIPSPWPEVPKSPLGWGQERWQPGERGRPGAAGRVREGSAALQGSFPAERADKTAPRALPLIKSEEAGNYCRPRRVTHAPDYLQ